MKRLHRKRISDGMAAAWANKTRKERAAWVRSCARGKRRSRKA